MAIAHDAASSPAMGTGTLSWTHTPVGTPAGVDVQIGTTLSSADGVTGVTYGGVALTRYALGTNAGGQLSTAHGYHLGSGIPTGPQTVVVSVTGAFNRGACCKTVTAAGDTAVDSSSTGNGAGVTNPTLTVTTVAADTVVYAGAGITENTAAVSVTAPDISLNQTGNTNETQIFARNSVNGTTGAVTIGWTFNNDSWAGVIVALKEVTVVATTPPELTMAPRIPTY